jgi:hypothetical protein
MAQDRSHIREEGSGTTFVREEMAMAINQNSQQIQAEKTVDYHAMFLKEASTLALYLSLTQNSFAAS